MIFQFSTENIALRLNGKQSEQERVMELQQPQSSVYDLNLYEWRLHAPFAPDNARLVYLLCDEAHYRDTERRLSSITLRGPIRSLTRQNDSSLVYSLPLRAGLSDTDLA